MPGDTEFPVLGCYIGRPGLRGEDEAYRRCFPGRTSFFDASLGVSVAAICVVPDLCRPTLIRLGWLGPPAERSER